MKSIKVKLAGVIVCLDLAFEENVQRFEPYVTDGIAEGRLSVSPSRLYEEIALLKAINPAREISGAEAENNALYRDVSLFLWEHDILTFHGVFLEIHNSGYVFTGPSGIGKSYHASLWQQEFGDSVHIINGDKLFLKLEAHGLMGYGTPWTGKEHVGLNIWAHVGSICKIIRGKENSIKSIDNKQNAISWLIEQSMLKNRQSQHLALIRWFKAILPEVGLYELTCNKDASAAIVAYNGMNVQ